MAEASQPGTATPEVPIDDNMLHQQADSSSSPPVAAAAEATAAEAGAAAGPSVPQIAFKVQWGKHSADLKRPASSTIGELKAEVERQLSIPPDKQKFLFKGVGVKDDAATLEKVGIKNGAKVLLIGSSPAEIAAAAKQPPAAAGEGAKLAWDAPKEPEDVCKQPQHAKIIAKGPPEEAMPGLRDKQVPLPDSLNALNGLYNSMGTKVRLTFKPDVEQLWISSATSTQRLSYGSITKVETWPIVGHEQYSIVALQLSSGKYWLYFWPSQYNSGLKIRLVGVHALL